MIEFICNRIFAYYYYEENDDTPVLYMKNKSYEENTIKTKN